MLGRAVSMLFVSVEDPPTWRFMNMTFCISVTNNFALLCFLFDCGFGWVGVLSLFLSWRVRNLDQTVFDS